MFSMCFVSTLCATSKRLAPPAQQAPDLVGQARRVFVLVKSK